MKGRSVAALLMYCGVGLAATPPKLPDWGGTWSNEGAVFLRMLGASSAALNAAAAERSVGYRERFNSVDGLNRREQVCQPNAFAGYSGGFEGSIEFVFAHDRVMLLWEGGLVRRIYTDGRKLPENPEPSAAGSSVGHWEGDTLVVETRGLRANAAPFSMGTGSGPLALGEGALVRERMRLRGADLLEIEVELTAPAIYRQPAKVALSYQRHRDLPMGEFTTCPDFDRSLDPVTGFQRFDLTPPADLPPPPE